jgi:hypothetical protein
MTQALPCVLASVQACFNMDAARMARPVARCSDSGVSLVPYQVQRHAQGVFNGLLPGQWVNRWCRVGTLNDAGVQQAAQCRV